MSANVLSFSLEPLYLILEQVRSTLKREGRVRVRVPNPDLALGLYPGERTEAGIHRPYSVWLDMADRLECYFLTPSSLGEQVELTFVKSQARASEQDVEKYDPDSEFGRINKLEDPCFLEDMLEALKRINLKAGARVLSVGVNTGRELELLEQVYPDLALEVIGLDLNARALEVARERFPQFTFIERDLNDLPFASLGKFDLIVCLSVLQSSSIDKDVVFRTLLREHLSSSGAIIIGLPNCRYLDGRVSYGARMRNFRKPDLSLLLADSALYRRHLQKHGFRVYVTGKYEVLLTAVRI